MGSLTDHIVPAGAPGSKVENGKRVMRDMMPAAATAPIPLEHRGSDTKFAFGTTHAKGTSQPLQRVIIPEDGEPPTTAVNTGGKVRFELQEGCRGLHEMQRLYIEYTVFGTNTALLVPSAWADLELRSDHEQQRIIAWPADVVNQVLALTTTDVAAEEGENCNPILSERIFPNLTAGVDSTVIVEFPIRLLSFISAKIAKEKVHLYVTFRTEGITLAPNVGGEVLNKIRVKAVGYEVPDALVRFNDKEHRLSTFRAGYVDVVTHQQTESIVGGTARTIRVKLSGADGRVVALLATARETGDAGPQRHFWGEQTTFDFQDSGNSTTVRTPWKGIHVLYGDRDDRTVSNLSKYGITTQPAFSHGALLSFSDDFGAAVRDGALNGCHPVDSDRHSLFISLAGDDHVATHGPNARFSPGTAGTADYVITVYAFMHRYVQQEAETGRIVKA